MFPASTYVIRLAGDADEAALERLAQLDSAAPLEHPVLVGEIGGRVSAALDLDSGEWRLRDRPERLPHTYTLQAVKQ